MDNYRNQPYCPIRGQENYVYATQASEMDQMKSMDELPIAMAYVPWQKWEEPYELDKAMNAGTIFPELNKPFLGYERWRNNATT